MPQLSQNFLCDAVATNEFIKENKKLQQMVNGAIASSNELSGHKNRSDSLCATRKEVYVFSWRGIGEHIIKFEFLTLIL